MLMLHCMHGHIAIALLTCLSEGIKQPNWYWYVCFIIKHCAFYLDGSKYLYQSDGTNLTG